MIKKNFCDPGFKPELKKLRFLPAAERYIFFILNFSQSFVRIGTFGYFQKIINLNIKLAYEDEIYQFLTVFAVDINFIIAG